MKHLSNDDVLALAEGGSRGGPHAESCAKCRAQVDALRGVLASIRQDEVPEPSPLFWAHLSERVRQAVAAGSESAPDWGGRFGLWRPMAAVGACVTIVLAIFLMRGQAPPALDEAASRTATPVAARAVAVPEPSASGPLTGSVATARTGSEAGAVAGADMSWTLIADLAAGLDLDSAGEAGLVISPGSAERAVGQLSDEERRWFAKLLLEELSRPEL